MMAHSVLGKRSRNHTEETVAQPARKRTTRSSIPEIYEDAEIKSQPPPSAHIRNRKKASVKAKPGQITKAEHADVEIQDAPELETIDVENCPPESAAYFTPSTLRYKDVQNCSPITPKHRVRVLGGLLTPRTPRSSETSKVRTQNIYAQARQLFVQSATPAKIIGRDGERQQLKGFIAKAKATKHGGCMYISGPPGTGKSALAYEVLRDFEADVAFTTSKINCIGLRSTTQVYDHIITDLGLSKSSKIPPEVQLRRLFTSKSTTATYVILLDEVDSLADLECETLYNIFEWALHPASSLTLIGIANALDLTDRMLPRLKSKGLKPQLLPFLPYTASQISTIVSDKLKSLLSKETADVNNFVPCVHPAAIQLCGKKIASQTGDLRKAFHLIRKAIDLIEKETVARQVQNSPVKPVLGDVTNSATYMPPALFPAKQATLNFAAADAPRASIAHVAKIASSIFNNSTVSRLAGLNLQQKAVLCSVLSKERKTHHRDLFSTPTKQGNKAPTVAELFSKYTLLCKRDDDILQPLKVTEFRDVIASLETLGLVHESNSRSSTLLTPSSSSRSTKNSTDRQIATSVTEKEMTESLTGPGAELLKRLLDEY